MGVIGKRVIGEWGTMLPDLLNFLGGGFIVQGLIFTCGQSFRFKNQRQVIHMQSLLGGHKNITVYHVSQMSSPGPSCQFQDRVVAEFFCGGERNGPSQNIRGGVNRIRSLCCASHIQKRLAKIFLKLPLYITKQVFVVALRSRNHMTQTAPKLEAQGKNLLEQYLRSVTHYTKI